MFYVIDFQEQGLGRNFWYVWSDSPDSLPRIHNMREEQWEYLKVGLKKYKTYREVRDIYPFMPETFVPPTQMHIRWL